MGKTLRLPRRDQLVMYTGGEIEARSAERDGRFPREGLSEAVCLIGRSPANSGGLHLAKSVKRRRVRPRH